MNRKKRIELFFSHIYIFSTALATVCAFLFSSAGMFFFNLIGASSGHVVWGMLLSERQLPVLGVWIILSWAFVMPIYLIISYILAIKKHIIPLCIFLVIDSVIVVSYVIYSFIIENTYGGYYFLLDAILSVIFAATMFFLQFKDRGQGGGSRKTGDGLREGQGDGSPVSSENDTIFPQN